MYKKIYVCSPTDRVTGGTELLQQLVYKLRKIGQNAYVYYLASYEGSEVEKVFGDRYSNPTATKIEDDRDNILIAAESCIATLLPFKNITKAIWWLSVDNYGGALKKNPHFLLRCYFKVLDKLYSMFDNEWLHFVQSEYAYQYCLNDRGIKSDHIYCLADYLSRAFIDSNMGGVKLGNDRKDIVLYNPLKGKEFTQQLIKQNNSFDWRPIVNMTSQEIASLMKRSKVYIDFGNHPGKDRIPREAAICGCCIITGKRGAAHNNIDIEIPDKYKFDETEVYQIGETIQYCLIHFDDCYKDFEGYRNKIRQEEAVFEKEICEIFNNNTHPVVSYGFCSKYVKRPISVLVNSILNAFVRIRGK